MNNICHSEIVDAKIWLKNEQDIFKPETLKKKICWLLLGDYYCLEIKSFLIMEMVKSKF